MKSVASQMVMEAGKNINLKDSKSISWSPNKVELIRGGKEYFDLLLNLIHKASDSIHLQTYIFHDDETGVLVADALKAAATRKVDIYLLTDGYASQSLSRKFIAELKLSGIHFRFFEPLFKSRHFYFGRRMHHKVFVADAKYALVGGINVANRYNDMLDQQAWLDFSLYAEGEVARDICVLCWKTWNNFHLNMGSTPCEEKALIFDLKEDETSAVRMRRNDWVRHKDEISATYIEMIRSARSHITIMCSYFIPGRIVRLLLQRAANRGVKIRVITAGPSDVMLAKYAERWMYDWLLRNKIELYEYQPTILHAKIAACDSKWVTIGSYNINDISAYASIELNLDVNNPSFAQKLEQIMDNIILRDCQAITQERHMVTKNFLKQFFRWLSYIIYSGVFKMLTFYFKQSRI